MAWLSCDTALIKAKTLKDKKAGRPMVVRNLADGSSKTVKNVGQYSFSKNGSHLAMTLIKQKKDSLTTNGVAVVKMADNTLSLISRDKPFFGMPVFNEESTKLAFIASSDSVET